MDEFSPIVEGIQFGQQRRGYDVAAVDLFVDRVAAAVAQARARIAELERRSGGATSAVVGSAEEQASRLLILAQRTADAVLEEATSEAERVRSEATADAERLRREAEDHASRLRAEAETDRREKIKRAEQEATEAGNAERAIVAAAIATLDGQREVLAADVAALESFVGLSREQITAAVSTLQRLLDDPDSLRIVDAPELQVVERAEVANPEDLTAFNDEPASAEDEPGTGRDAQSEPVEVFESFEAETAAVEAVVIPSEAVVDEAAPLIEDDPFTFDPGPMPDAVGILSDQDLATESGLAPETDRSSDEPESGGVVWAEEPPASSSVFGEDPPPAPPEDPTTGEAPSATELFDVAADDDRSGSDADVLDQLREAANVSEEEQADIAMTAFFDDDDGDGNRNWFSRRR